MATPAQTTIPEAKELRTVIVTGASSGIGAYCARALKAEGWRVFATARKPDDILSLSYALSKSSFAVVGPKEAGRAHVQVDANQAFEMTGCVNAICPLPPQPSASLLEQMRVGSILSIEMVTKRGNIVGPYNVSLTGFAAEYQQALKKQQAVVRKPATR